MGTNYWKRIQPVNAIQSPRLFLSSVDDISMRNFSSGIDMNISFNTSGISRSSRTWKRRKLKSQMPNERVAKTHQMIKDEFLYLENSINLSATYEECAACSFAFKKCSHHIVIIPTVVFRLQEWTFSVNIGAMEVK